jgi:hypothetical protein
METMRTEVQWRDGTPGVITNELSIHRDPSGQRQVWLVDLNAECKGTRVRVGLRIPFSAWDQLSGDDPQKFSAVSQTLVEWASHANPADVTGELFLDAFWDGSQLRIDRWSWLYRESR